MKEIEFLLELKGYTPTVLCSIFENPVSGFEDNQGAISLTVSRQMQPRTKHIKRKYHYFRSFFLNGDVEIKHVDTK